jgi:hypothetical protein
VRVNVTEQHIGHTSEPTLRDLSEALIAVYGTDYGIHGATWISRFTDMTRQAASYRDRRGAAGRRRRTRASPGGWTGPPNRGAGCGEFGMEAGACGLILGIGLRNRRGPRKLLSELQPESDRRCGAQIAARF